MGTVPIVSRNLWEKLELPIKAASTFVSAVSLTAALVAGIARVVATDLLLIILCVGTGLLFLSSASFLFVALKRRNVLLLTDCTDLTNTDPSLAISQTLRDLSAKAGHLIVLGRTCFRWFSASEENRSDNGDGPGLIEVAVANGARLSFYVMSPSKVLDLESFAKNPVKRKQLREQLQQVEAIFLRAQERLRKMAKAPSGRLELAFTSSPVPNSKSLLKDRRGNMLRFVCELSADFDVKPAIVFLGEPKNKKDLAFLRVLRSDLESVEGSTSADGKEGIFEKRHKGRDAVAQLIAEYHYAPNLRKNSSLLLAHTFLGHFRHLKYPQIFQRIPPVTVQLHLTNRCTTKCKMCRHYLLALLCQGRLGRTAICSGTDSPIGRSMRESPSQRGYD